MTRKLLYTLLLLLGATATSTPSWAKAKAPPEKSEHFYLIQDDERLLYDERLLEAAELAKLTARKSSHRRCWHAVKNALFEANAVPFRPTSKYAWQAGEELEEKFSFRKLNITDPYEAPIGSLLVYGGPGAGHIEFRVEEGFVSDFSNPRPSHRPLIGVYVSSAAVYKGSPQRVRY